MKRYNTIGFFVGLRQRVTRLAQRAACALAALGACTALAQVAQSAQPAQIAAPIAAITPARQARPALGTLILTPAQRRSLEALRNAPLSDERAAVALPADRLSEVVSSLPDTLVVSGVVVRSGNRSTVWVNGEALYGRITDDPLRTLARQAGVLQRGTKDLQLRARPGQVIDATTGQALDLLPPDAVRIIPPKAGYDSSAGAHRANPTE